MQRDADHHDRRRRQRDLALSPVAGISISRPDSAATPMSDLLRDLAADGADQHEAGDQRADDRADGVGGVDAADQARRVLTAARPPRPAPAESSRPTASRRAA